MAAAYGLGSCHFFSTIGMRSSVNVHKKNLKIPNNTPIGLYA
jgi:hypothetical protein